MPGADLGDVASDLGFEWFDAGEGSLITDPAEEVQPDAFAVQIVGESEQVGFDDAALAMEGGFDADANRGGVEGAFAFDRTDARIHAVHRQLPTSERIVAQIHRWFARAARL